MTDTDNGGVRRHEITELGKIILSLILPFACGAVFIFSLFLLLPYATFILLIGMMAIYFIPPAGKESVIPVSIGLGLDWWLIAFCLAMMDIICALFMTLNFDLALKVPYLGTKLMQTVVNTGESFFDRHPWVKRFSTLGLTIFVFIPLQGTGGLTTPVVGRVIGMSKKSVMTAVIAGSFASTYAIALGSEYVYLLLQADLWLGILAIVIIAIAIASIVMYYRKWQNKQDEINSQAKNSSNPQRSNHDEFENKNDNSEMNMK